MRFAAVVPCTGRRGGHRGWLRGTAAGGTLSLPSPGARTRGCNCASHLPPSRNSKQRQRVSSSSMAILWRPLPPWWPHSGDEDECSWAGRQRYRCANSCAARGRRRKQTPQRAADSRCSRVDHSSLIHRARVQRVWLRQGFSCLHSGGPATFLISRVAGRPCTGKAMCGITGIDAGSGQHAATKPKRAACVRNAGHQAGAARLCRSQHTSAHLALCSMRIFCCRGGICWGTCWTPAAPPGSTSRESAESSIVAQFPWGPGRGGWVQCQPGGSSGSSPM
jgi:hypothetical protein